MKTAIITGGTGAIGAELVKEFSKDYKVVFTYLNNKSMAKKLCEKYKAHSFGCDVTDRYSVDLIMKRYPACDLLINNAGISQIKLLTEMTELDWYKMLDVHLTGAFNFSQGVLPIMIRKKSGCIINITSIWGSVGASCEVHYSTAKAGLIGFTKALAKEVAPSNIRVNAIAPGIIESNMNNHLAPDEMKQLVNEIPMMRIGKPHDVAIAARYIAEANYVTGQILGVDGGFS